MPEGERSMYYTEQHIHSFDGTRLYVRESGEKTKPLLVLIHGGSTDADFYVNTAKPLSRYFHVISYTRRGHVGSDLTATTKGPTEATKTDKTALKDIVAVHTKDAACIIDYFGNEVDKTLGAYVVVHSLAGPIGMELVSSYPEKVRKLLCVEPSWDVRNSLRNGLRALMPPIVFADRRGPTPSQEMIDNIGPDKEMMTTFDWHIMLYRPKKDLLKKAPILFAVGEQSKGRVIYEETVRLAKELEKPLFYHPGVHNTGFNLPNEFAYLVAGALLDPEF